MEKRKLILSGLYFFGWLVLFILPNRFYYQQGDSQLVVVFLMCFLALPTILFFALKEFNISDKNVKTITYASGFLVIPFIFFIKSEGQNELENYQKETKGLVTKAWMHSRYKKIAAWTVNVRYVVNNETYKISFKKDRNKILSRGDTVTIIYSSKTPAISEIKELEKYYKKSD